MDGMWPAEEVRVILETLKNSRLEAGMIRGRLNRRGVTSRGVFDGGSQENAVADSYWDNARKMNASSPRTAAMHAVLAQEYERDAFEKMPELSDGALKTDLSYWRKLRQEAQTKGSKGPSSTSPTRVIIERFSHSSIVRRRAVVRSFAKISSMRAASGREKNCRHTS